MHHDLKIKLDLIKRSDLENLGNHYIVMGFEKVLKNSYSQAAEYFKQGLDLVTCGCGNSWNEEFSFNGEKLISKINFSMLDEIDNPDHHFVKAFILSYSNIKDNKTQLKEALNQIEKYLSIKTCKYGLFIKGLICSNLNLNKTSIDSFIKANEIGNLNCVNYRIALLKESMEDSYGLDDLLDTLIINPSSICCAYHLAFNWTKRRLAWELQIPPSVKPHKFSLRINDFTDQMFMDEYIKILANEKSLNYDLLRLSPNQEVSDFFNYLDGERGFLKSQKEFIFQKKKEKMEIKKNRLRPKGGATGNNNQSTIILDGLDVDQYPPEFWDN